MSEKAKYIPEEIMEEFKEDETEKSELDKAPDNESKELEKEIAERKREVEKLNQGNASLKSMLVSLNINGDEATKISVTAALRGEQKKEES